MTAGDAWTLVMPGLAVAIHDLPRAIEVTRKGIPLQVTVTMMCGCQLEPGGLWDADEYEVKAQLRRDGTVMREVGLSFAGVESEFAARVPLEGPGRYELLVFAYHAVTGNTGVDRVWLDVD